MKHSMFKSQYMSLFSLTFFSDDGHLNKDVWVVPLGTLQHVRTDALTCVPHVGAILQNCCICACVINVFLFLAFLFAFCGPTMEHGGVKSFCRS